MIFFTKFDLYNSAFESLFLQIIKTWKLLFDQSEPNFFANFCLQRETVLPLSRNMFLLSIGASLVGKAGFSKTHGNMCHVSQQNKIKIIK